MPIIDIVVQAELDTVSVRLTAIVDSGADSTMIPTAVLDKLKA